METGEGEEGGRTCFNGYILPFLPLFLPPHSICSSFSLSLFLSFSLSLFLSFSLLSFSLLSFSLLSFSLLSSVLPSFLRCLYVSLHTSRPGLYPPRTLLIPPSYLVSKVDFIRSHEGGTAGDEHESRWLLG
jgi:hypothetical protein